LDVTSEIKEDACSGALLSVSIDKYFISGMEIKQILNTLRQARNDAYAPIDFLLSLRYDSSPAMAEILTDNINKYDGIFETFKGIDLVGNEKEMKKNNLEDFVGPWKNKGKIIRAHVGEYGDERNIAYAVKIIKVNRIAHGICVEDPNLISEIKDNNIPLDICISSNFLTSNVKHIMDHPLKRLLKQGLRITIGTDDPTVFNTDMSKELRYCKLLLGDMFESFYLRLCHETY
jgi:adenosine deaminase